MNICRESALQHIQLLIVHCCVFVVVAKLSLFLSALQLKIDMLILEMKYSKERVY